MGLVESVRFLLSGKSRYELQPSIYYEQFLTGDDSRHLKDFVEDFGPTLAIPSAVIAVGSSTYPAVFWDERKKLNQINTHATVKAREQYADIDLLVVPESQVQLAELEKAVQEALSSLGYQWNRHETTDSGVSYHKQSDGSFAGFLHMDYGLHSISTNLKNKTKLDLILGRDDLLKTTADEKISQEKKDGHAFSLLYRR